MLAICMLSCLVSDVEHVLMEAAFICIILISFVADKASGRVHYLSGEMKVLSVR
jgi:hypothetical protein